MKNGLPSFKEAAKCLFYENKQYYSKKFYLKRKILPHLKRKKKDFVKKICGFIDLEFVKTCHEHVKSFFLSHLGCLKVIAL